MEARALQTHVPTAAVPLEKLAANPKLSDAEKVAEVSRQFEAVFLRQILQDARKSGITSSTTPESATKAIYDDLVDNQLADNISRSGEFGLARCLRAQLARQVLPPAGAESKPDAGAAGIKALTH
jgi:flagellar protein FlgJ